MGLISGVLLTIIALNVRSIIGWIKALFIRENKIERNDAKLNWMMFLMFLTYIITLVLSIVVIFPFSPSIGSLIFILIVILGLFTVFGVFLIKDNYKENEKYSDRMVSLGETILSTTLQLLIGSISVGLVIGILTSALSK